MLVNVTISGNTYPSYLSVAEADVFLEVEVNRRAAWQALSADDKTRMLVASTRRIDFFEFRGEKADPNQATKWPRQQGEQDDLPPDAVSTGTDIPAPIEEATALLAGTIAISPSAAGVQHPDSDKEFLKSVMAGSAKVEFYTRNRNATGGTVRLDTGDAAQLVDEEAQLLLRPYLFEPATQTGRTAEALAGGTFAFGTEQQGIDPEFDRSRAYA